MLMVQKLTFFGMFFAFERVFPISPVLNRYALGIHLCWCLVLILIWLTH